MSGAWRGPRLGVQHAVRTDLRPTLEGPGRRTVGPSGPLNFSTTFVSERLMVSLHMVDEADASVRPLPIWPPMSESGVASVVPEGWTAAG